MNHEVLKKFFPPMSLEESMLHTLYSRKRDDNTCVTKPEMIMEYGFVLKDLAMMGYIKITDPFYIELTEKGLAKIEMLREQRGLKY